MSARTLLAAVRLKTRAGHWFTVDDGALMPLDHARTLARWSRVYGLHLGVEVVDVQVVRLSPTTARILQPAQLAAACARYPRLLGHLAPTTTPPATSPQLEAAAA